MTLPVTERIDKLAKRLKARTQRDGKPLPGYEQNVAQIRAELEQLSLRADYGDEDNGRV